VRVGDVRPAEATGPAHETPPEEIHPREGEATRGVRPAPPPLLHLNTQSK